MLLKSFFQLFSLSVLHVEKPILIREKSFVFVNEEIIKMCDYFWLWKYDFKKRSVFWMTFLNDSQMRQAKFFFYFGLMLVECLVEHERDRLIQNQGCSASHTTQKLSWSLQRPRYLFGGSLSLSRSQFKFSNDRECLLTAWFVQLHDVDSLLLGKSFSSQNKRFIFSMPNFKAAPFVVSCKKRSFFWKL